jgi:predicted PurR-regulated permease PerM
MPHWAQVFLIPAVLLALWILGQTIGHALMVFIVSVLVAMLLNPLVRALRRLRIPRGLAVLLVFLSFTGAISAGIYLVIPPVRGQVEEIQRNLPVYSDQAQREVQDIQRWFDERGWDVNVQERADAAIDAIRDKASELADNVVTYSLDLLSILVTLIVILVASIYMLLDAPRIARFAGRIGGPGAVQFLRRTERTLTQYVKAQLLVSLIIAVSAGLAMWIYGITGIFELGATYAVAFAAWVFLTEFIPYVGPIIGAVPPVLIALFTSPLTALWVALAFLAIHQLEGHVVVPKIMGTAVGVHPLVVIFGLLVGEQLYGLAGVLLAIPMVVVVKETVMFVGEKLGWFPPAPEAVERAPQPGPDLTGAATETAPTRLVPVGTQTPGDTRELPTRIIESPDA